MSVFGDRLWCWRSGGGRKDADKSFCCCRELVVVEDVDDGRRMCGCGIDHGSLAALAGWRRGGGEQPGWGINDQTTALGTSMIVAYFCMVTCWFLRPFVGR